jgi:hypothetical protein
MSNDQFEIPVTDCLLFNTGAVSCVPVIKYVSKCQVDYTYWPYDQQKCRIVFGSWTHSGKEIDFHLDGNGVCELLNLLLQNFVINLHHIYVSYFSNIISKKILQNYTIKLTYLELMSKNPCTNYLDSYTNFLIHYSFHIAFFYFIYKYIF